MQASIKRFFRKDSTLMWSILMEAIKRIHPYEEPVINAIPLWGTGFSDLKLKS